MYPKNYNPDSFVSVPGERYKTEYIGEPDEFGVIKLVPVGKTDLVEMHQRDVDLNDVNILYERFCNGDVTAFAQRQGTFMDVCGMPRDLRGMFDMVSSFDEAYANLSPEMKQKYTREEFIKQAGSEQWIKDFTPAPVPSTAEPAPAHASTLAAE